MSSFVVNSIEKVLSENITSFSKFLETKNISTSDKLVELWNEFSKMTIKPAKKKSEKSEKTDDSAGDTQCSHVATRGINKGSQCKSKATKQGKSGMLCTKHHKAESEKETKSATASTTKKVKTKSSGNGKSKAKKEKEEKESEEESEESSDEEDSTDSKEKLSEVVEKSVPSSKLNIKLARDKKTNALYNKETNFVMDPETKTFIGKLVDGEVKPLTDEDKTLCKSKVWPFKE